MSSTATADEADKKKWIFKLRPGVTFHDGCPWNADSAIWNFARVLDPKSPQFQAEVRALFGAKIAAEEAVFVSRGDHMMVVEGATDFGSWTSSVVVTGIVEEHPTPPPVQLTPLRAPSEPSSFTTNFGTTKSEIPFTPGGASGSRASTR